MHAFTRIGTAVSSVALTILIAGVHPADLPSVA